MRNPLGHKTKAELKDASGNEANHGRLYPNCNTPANNELLETSEIDRRTNSYEPTEAGETWPPPAR